MMVKEPKNIDFYTSGRQPSEQDFMRISECIRVKKENSALSKTVQINKAKKKIHTYSQ